MTDQFIPTHININDFNVTERVNSITVPKKDISIHMKVLKHLLYHREKIKPVVPIDESTSRILLETPMTPKLTEIIEKQKYEIEEYELSLTIENFTSHEIMKKYIPSNIQLPTSYETVGELAHMNLKEEQMEYKYIIGEAYLLKTFPRIKTFITKTAEISNEFRTFPMEVIAGINSTEVSVICHGVKFTLDYAKCYWNTRLETEHIRIIENMKENEILCDAFAGVGPFAIPAALKGVKVYANDLNPDSTKYMKINAERNKVNIEIETMDAREYMKKIVLEKKIQPHYILMNLPATAVEFLDVIPELNLEHCTIHCYGFSAFEDARDLVQRANELLKKEYEITVRKVRDVAPKKLMFCLNIHVNQNELKRQFEDVEKDIPDAKRKLE